MDLPEEDKTAIAKRRAIQSLMKNKSLNPSQRHIQMQEIMKGNFPMEEEEDDDDGDNGEARSDVESSSGSEYSSSKSGGESSSSSGSGSSSSSYDGSSMEDTQSGDESISLSASRSGSESYSSRSQYSGSQYSRSQHSAQTETEDNGGRASASSRGSRHGSRVVVGGGGDGGGASSSHNGRSGDNLQAGYGASSSRTDFDRRDSMASMASSSNASSANNNSSAQKDKQKALLEISRDKSLSAKERQAKMKEIMQTPVRSASSAGNDKDNKDGDSNIQRRGGGGPPITLNDKRRPSRSNEEMQDSIRECTVDEQYGVKPLRMSRRRITGNVMELKDIVERINRNEPGLTKIELQKMNLTDEDVIPVLEALGKNEFITSLDLRRNRIGIEGCSTLASAILDNTTLTSIDISGNNLGDEGLEDLSKVIPYNKALITLNIEDNKIGDTGATSFAESLRENVTLKEINLSGNLIGDVGAGDLFKVLSSANDTVTSILLRFNAISDKAATELASALLDNETLKVVDLGHNKITNRGAQDLLKVVSINDSLEVLELGGNINVDEDMLNEVQRALEADSDSESEEEEESGSESASSYSEVASSRASLSRGPPPSRASSSRGGASTSRRGRHDPVESECESDEESEKASSSRAPSRASLSRRGVLSGSKRGKPVDSASESEVESENESITMDDNDDHSSSDGDDENSNAGPTGGEAMLEDMPDESHEQLAKRQLIQETMKNKRLSPQERAKKMQDIMAGRVKLPKVEPKKQAKARQPRPRGKPQAAAPAVTKAASSSSDSEEEADEHPEEAAPVPVAASAASNGGELTGGEAMLTDMPDEDNTALAKRKAIQAAMQDRSLSAHERNKKIQDIMAGKVELPKVEAKKPPAAKPSGRRAVTRRPQKEEKPKKQARARQLRVKPHAAPDVAKVEESSDSEEEIDEQPEAAAPAPAAAISASDGGELTGGEAMLTDMPDEDNTALAKRKAIQAAMQDRSLSAHDRNKKIQDIMAGKVELPKVEAKKPPVAAKQADKKPPAPRGRRGREPTNEIRREEISDSSQGSESSQSRSVEAKPAARGRRGRGTANEIRKEEISDSSHSSEEELTEAPPAAAASADGGELTGGEAMLTDMPDEDNTALAKRKAIQAAMQDRSLSAQERNKRIQDVMAGKVELPKVEAKNPPAAAASKTSRRGVSARRPQKEESESESESEDDSESGSSYDDSETRGSSIENNNANVPNDAGGPTGGEAMLQDMPDESDDQLAKRAAIQQIMKDKSLSPQERSKKMQDVTAGRVKLPPARKKPAATEAPVAKPKAEPAKSRAVSKSKEQRPRKNDAVASARKPAMPSREASNQRDVVASARNNATLSSRGVSDLSLDNSDRSRNERPAKQVSITSEKRSDGNISDISLPKKHAPKRPVMDTYDGGLRTAIAHEWKQRMMAVHPRSHDNMLDILLAHQYRLSLKFPPNQSFFRVVAVVFFSRVVDGMRRTERYHVVGTNDEPHSIAGSICAERAALMQLRFIPDLEEITKVVIVTDAVDAISPGMLCREFMASHDRIPWNVPIVLGRSVCRKCGLTVSGKACSDFAGCFNEATNDTLRDVNGQIFATCDKGHEESKSKEYSTPHDFVGTVTTLKDLFPYPSLYTRMSANEALKFGESYIENGAKLSKGGKSSKEANVRAYFANNNKRFNDAASTGSYRQERFDLTMLTDILEEDEEGGAGGGKQNQSESLTSNGSSNTTNQLKNGTENSNQNADSIVSNGTQSIDGRRAASPGTVKSSMTKSLKTTIDFMRQVREDRHELDASGLSGLSDLPGTLDHLTARTIRISSRLKPSQRREKLIRFATEVTAMESHQKHMHPIRYGAAVLFSDGTVAIASQKVALEYGCTLDAVGQLASAIDRKAIQIEEDSPPCRPILLVQCDQFGIAHAPFAQGRAFLTERGYGDCKILIHQQKHQKEATVSEEEHNASVGDITMDKMENIDLRLLEVGANNLAPAPPDIFGGLINKNHSQQGGLQIQF